MFFIMIFYSRGFYRFLIILFVILLIIKNQE
jgi:hypothetical protein